MSRAILLAGFALLGAGVAALDVAARAGVGNLPTLGQVADEVMHRPAGRVSVLLGWLWLGWHLFVR